MYMKINIEICQSHWHKLHIHKSGCHWCNMCMHKNLTYHTRNCGTFLYFPWMKQWTRKKQRIKIHRNCASSLQYVIIYYFFICLKIPLTIILEVTTWLERHECNVQNQCNFFCNYIQHCELLYKVLLTNKVLLKFTWNVK